MYKRKVAHDEIERRIAERDQLLARVQRPGEQASEGPHGESRPSELQRLVARVTRLECALLRLLDNEWLACASAEELAAHARVALGPESPAEPKAMPAAKARATPRARAAVKRRA